MEQHNFKIGDKVRIIGNAANETGDGDVIHHNFCIGDEGTINYIDGDGILIVDVGGLWQYVSPQHVETVEEVQE